jgi:hypothetical protein
MYLAADFEEKESTIRALKNLKSKGFGPDDLDLYSDEPVELPRGVLDRPSRMSFIVVSGALTFLLLTISFVYFTQHNYPVVTGGMPLFSPWATGVVFYELTMLGAIVTTVIMFLKEGGLLRWKRPQAVPVIEPDVICLRVQCRSEQAANVREWLTAEGGRNVRTIEATQ